MRNIANVSKREIVAQRRFVTGVTAGTPVYKEVDSLGHKEFMVDVYIGPGDVQTANVIKDVPVAPYAKQLVSGIRQPITLERSKQGKYTVIGRAKVLAGGAQMPGESILDPSYHEVRHNLADLGLLFVADLDYTLEPFQSNGSVELQADPDKPFQTIIATDAFGRQVLGPDAENPLPLYDTDPARTTKTKHVVIMPACLGPYGNPLAMKWGDPDSVLQPMIQQVVELET